MNDIFKRPILSFVTRNGRSSLAQKRALDNHWTQYGLNCPEDAHPLDFSELFNTDTPPILEIGFGMGHSLLQQALQSPKQPFMGIEVHAPGVGKLLNEIAKHDLKNLRIFKVNAIDVLEKAIPAASLSCVQLFFPDPWHKTKHHKRRLVQTEFVNLIAQKLKSGGLFHMATDWSDYADHMRSVLMDNPFFKAVDPTKLAALIEQRPKTKFENRGIRLGHLISDLAYLKL